MNGEFTAGFDPSLFSWSGTFPGWRQFFWILVAFLWFGVHFFWISVEFYRFGSDFFQRVADFY